MHFLEAPKQTHKHAATALIMLKNINGLSKKKRKKNAKKLNACQMEYEQRGQQVLY